MPAENKCAPDISTAAMCEYALLMLLNPEDNVLDFLHIYLNIAQKGEIVWFGVWRSGQREKEEGGERGVFK